MLPLTSSAKSSPGYLADLLFVDGDPIAVTSPSCKTTTDCTTS
jgi:hypothetical protein